MPSQDAQGGNSAPAQALPGKQADFDLRLVQPATLLGRVMNGEAIPDSTAPLLSQIVGERLPTVNVEIIQVYDQYYEMLADQVPIPDLVIYLQAKLETLKKRIAKKKVPFEDRVSNEYLEAVVHAYEHFFFHYKSSDLLVIDTSEIDFVDRSEHLQELLQRLSQPVKGTQYFLPLGSAPAD